MPVNFNILAQTPTIASRFAEGQQFAQEQAQNAFMRQQQAENFAAQREQRLALAEERRAKQANAERRQQFLEGLSAKMAEGGHKLDRPTLSSMLQFGMQSGEDSLINLATQGLKALDEEDLYQREGQRLGTLQGAAPSAELGVEPSAAAPANVLAAPAFSRPQVQQMLLSPSARIREQGKALAATLPPEPSPAAPARLQDRFVPVGNFIFDRQEQKYITPPQAAIAATQERAAPAPKAPKEPPAVKPLTLQQETQRRDKLGKEFKTAVSALQTTQDVLDSLQNVRNAPGLDRATGFTGLLPSIPGGAAAQADVRLQNLKGKITALGKAQAAATGAIGSIANQEWKILSDQIAALESVKGTGPLLEQLDLVEAQAKGAMERIRDQYQRQFGEDFDRFPQFKDLPEPKSAIKGRKGGASVTPSTTPAAAPAAPKSGATVSNW